jgi:hypothetical protein
MVCSDGSLCVLRVATFTGDPVRITASDVLEARWSCNAVRWERWKSVCAIKGSSRHRIESPPPPPPHCTGGAVYLLAPPELLSRGRSEFSVRGANTRLLTVVTGAPCVHSLAFPWSGLNLKEILAILAMCLAFGWTPHLGWYLNRNVPRALSVVTGAP